MEDSWQIELRGTEGKGTAEEAVMDLIFAAGWRWLGPK